MDNNNFEMDLNRVVKEENAFGYEIKSTCLEVKCLVSILQRVILSLQ